MREKIAQMTIDCFAAESVVWMVAHYIDSGVEDYSVEAAMSKVFASEALQRSAYEALQIAAGAGFMRDAPYEQITRDCRILTIFEGTNEVLRLYIALSGLKDLGKSLGELKAAMDDIFSNFIKGFGVLTDYAERRLTQATGVGRDKLLTPLPDGLREAAGVVKGMPDEGCAVADMTLLAILLSDGGVGDYWDDVDQYVRNQLIEHQVLRQFALDGEVPALHIRGPLIFRDIAHLGIQRIERGR